MSAYTKRLTRRSSNKKDAWPSLRRATLALRAKQRRSAYRTGR